jgi:hypothetical protein
MGYKKVREFYQTLAGGATRPRDAKVLLRRRALLKGKAVA